MMKMTFLRLVPTIALCIIVSNAKTCPAAPPNIVLVMADDMGWGQTGYYNHPVLKTPHLDDMASHGLRFDRFYAGASNCSPTRATVMTGRTNDRTGVETHGFPMRPQETTVADRLASVGYATGHFGKWHLNGFRGVGVPILKNDPRSPGAFGFQTWLSVTNFFDIDPLMSRMGEFEQFRGDSSEVIVAEALKFIRHHAAAQRPFFTVIWYGSPHSPFKASPSDKSAFGDLDKASADHYGELVAMDRSIGTLRSGLKDLQIADNTLVWFCSDNGGLPKITPETVGGLRGFKNTLYEGGLRVPAVIEWPAGITAPRTTGFPACTMDILPTLTDIVGVPDDDSKVPLDGISLKPLLAKETGPRKRPIGFRHTDRTAWIDNDLKLVMPDARSKQWELYDLANDSKEIHNLIAERPDQAEQLRQQWMLWNQSVENSIAGKDYPEGKVIPADPGPRTWMTAEEYQPYLKQLLP
ncbi:MAG: sulfatase-like hydrolase/transferase [Planctomycetaceae bacterium]